MDILVSTQQIISIIASFFGILATFIGTISLVVAAYNLDITKRSTRAKFWLDLRQHFLVNHKTLDTNIQTASWNPDDSQVAETWPDICSYLGTFEHCFIMMRDKLIDFPTFYDVYSLRVQKLASNAGVKTRVEALMPHGYLLNWNDLVRQVEEERLRRLPRNYRNQPFSPPRVELTSGRAT